MKRIFYQMLPRLWRDGRFQSVTPAFLRRLKGIGVDYVWYTGVPRHATSKPFVKGDPGSPYSIEDWYEVNPYSGTLADFDALVARTHAAGLKVCMDWIPNHVAADYAGPLPVLDCCDYDWTDTRKVNWDDARTVDEMSRVLRFWAGRGVDAFRCDMVELVSAEKIGEVLRAVRAEFPSLLFAAEVYGRENYRRYLDVAGFDLLYDKSGVYDILRGIVCDGRSARELTWNWQGLGAMQPRMLNFLENHDEQRMPYWAGERIWAAAAYALLFGDASFLLYFGQEAGENAAEGHEGRTSIFEWCRPVTIGRIASGRGLDQREREIFRRWRELLSLAALPAFREGRNWDLAYCQGAGFDPDRHAAFARFSDDEMWVVVCNFSDAAAQVDIRIPEELLSAASDKSGRRTVPVRVAPWDYCAVRLLRLRHFACSTPS